MIHEIKMMVALPDDAPQMLVETVMNAAARGATDVPVPGGSPRLIGGTLSIKHWEPEVPAS